MRTAVVVGGGLSGATFACRVAAAGERVFVLERDSGPSEKVCGDFLSYEALGYLAKLGVDVPSLGAVPLRAVRLATGAGTTTVALPFAAASVSRRRLDDAVLVRAAALGAHVCFGARAREIGHAGPARSFVRLADGRTLEGDVVALASGKHDIRGLPRPPGRHRGLVAFKMHFTLAASQRAELAGHVELATFGRGYAGLQPIEGGSANLCLLLEGERLASLGGSWGRVLATLRSESPHLRRRLEGALAEWRRPLALASIPYGHLHIPAGDERLYRLGDQVAVIPSFAGDGMSMALHGANLAASMWLAGLPPRAYHERLAREVRGPMRLGVALSHLLVRAWGQRLVGAVARLFPRLVEATARRTRIAPEALDALDGSGAR